MRLWVDEYKENNDDQSVLESYRVRQALHTKVWRRRRWLKQTIIGGGGLLAVIMVGLWGVKDRAILWNNLVGGVEQVPAALTGLSGSLGFTVKQVDIALVPPSDAMLPISVISEDTYSENNPLLDQVKRYTHGMAMMALDDHTLAAAVSDHDGWLVLEAWRRYWPHRLHLRLSHRHAVAVGVDYWSSDRGLALDDNGAPIASVYRRLNQISPVTYSDSIPENTESDGDGDGVLSQAMLSRVAGDRVVSPRWITQNPEADRYVVGTLLPANPLVVVGRNGWTHAPSLVEFIANHDVLRGLNIGAHWVGDRRWNLDIAHGRRIVMRLLLPQKRWQEAFTRWINAVPPQYWLNDQINNQGTGDGARTTTNDITSNSISSVDGAVGVLYIDLRTHTMAWHRRETFVPVSLDSLAVESPS